VSSFCTPASHHQLLHLKLWGDEVKSHAKIGITTPGGPVVSSECRLFALGKLDRQLLVNSSLAICIEEGDLVPTKIMNYL